MVGNRGSAAGLPEVVQRSLHMVATILVVLSLSLCVLAVLDPTELLLDFKWRAS